MSFMSGFGDAFGWFGGALNGITGVTEQQERTYKQQQQAMAQQNAFNYHMWNLQNQYNSPAAQLARMREAGIDINPTSYALGTGNLSNTATFVGSENGFSGSGSPAGNPISMAIGVANGIADIRQKEQYTENLKQQNEIMAHNKKIAEDTGSVVGTTPSLEGTLVREGTAIAKIFAQAWHNARERYKKDHPDYNGW